MANETTQQQFRDFFEAAIEKQKNPDDKEEQKKCRQLRAQKVEEQFGL